MDTDKFNVVLNNGFVLNKTNENGVKTIVLNRYKELCEKIIIDNEDCDINELSDLAAYSLRILMQTHVL